MRGLVVATSFLGIDVAGASTFTAQGTTLIGQGVLVSTFPVAVGAEEFSLRLSTGLKFNQGVLRFLDGSIQSAAPVPASTMTFIPAQTFTHHAFGPCLDGSTVTLVMTETTFLAVVLNAAVNVTTTSGLGYNVPVALGVLMDGLAFQGVGGGGITEQARGVPFGQGALNASFLTRSVSKVTKGAHVFCLQAIVVAADGTGQLLVGRGSEFGAYELK